MLGIPHCLDSRLADGSNFVMSHAPAALYSVDFFSFNFCLWYSCLLEAEYKSQDILRPEGLGKLERKIQ
jgi:hypothetical protein